MKRVKVESSAGRIEQIDGKTVKWFNFTDEPLRVYGLPWLEENNGKFLRMPLRAKDHVVEDLWEPVENPSGGRVRFASDTTSLVIRLVHSSGREWPKAITLGTSGTDLYVEEAGKQYIWGSSIPQATGSLYVHHFFENIERKVRQFTLYLPVYNDLLSLEIGVDPDAAMHEPRSYRLPKPVLFYGNSNTQGGNASRPGNGFVPIIGRDLDIDIVNLGFSGSGRGEPYVAGLVSEIDAACFVLDYHGNIPTVEGLRTVYTPFYQRIRESHPATPILMLTPFIFTRARYDRDYIALREGRHQVILDTYNEAVKSGDRHVYFQDGAQFIDAETDGVYGDGNHLNDRGSVIVAEGLKPIIKTILRIL